MDILNDLSKIKELDKVNVLDSIGLFPQQCLQALEDTEKLETPSLNGKIDNIVVCGMGGSAFALEIVKSLFADKIKLPLEIIRDYNLPSYVNQNSLVFPASYSGTTAETLSCTKKAFEKKAKIILLTSGGKLAEMVKEKKASGYVFEEKHNPCHQPRVGTGYLVCGGLGLLIKAGLINLDFPTVKKAVQSLENKLTVDIVDNPAKQLARKLKDRFALLVASEFLTGAIHGFANQLNETAKLNSTYHWIPELNHHRLEGLQFPQSFKDKALFLFYQSTLYDKRNQIRYGITKEVIEKNNYQVLEHQCQGKDKIQQAFNTIIFNAYVSFYLGMLNNVDPSKIPWVDYFKAELKKHSV